MIYNDLHPTDIDPKLADKADTDSHRTWKDDETVYYVVNTISSLFSTGNNLEVSPEAFISGERRLGRLNPDPSTTSLVWGREA